MIITPTTHGLDAILGKSTAPRTKGLHMSEIYGKLFEYLEPKRFTGGTPDPLRLEMGLTFETMLEEGLKARLTPESGRPGELVSDEGIIYSPDLIVFNEVTRLGEIKLSWMSSREVPREKANGFPPQFDKWLVQMKAYCHCLNTPYARLYAFFINGDYRPPRPELLCWDITFSRQELEENWALIINFAKSVGLL